MDDFERENGTDFGQSVRFGLGGDEMPVRTVSQVLGACNNRSCFRLTKVHGLGAQQHVYESGDGISNAEANVTVL
jgi:hypothetical protein